MAGEIFLLLRWRNFNQIEGVKLQQLNLNYERMEQQCKKTKQLKLSASDLS